MNNESPKVKYLRTMKIVKEMMQYAPKMAKELEKLAKKEYVDNKTITNG